MRIGINVGYWSAGPPPGAAELVAEADRLGLDSVWTAEAYGSDVLTPLAFAGDPPNLAEAQVLGADREREELGAQLGGRKFASEARLASHRFSVSYNNQGVTPQPYNPGDIHARFPFANGMVTTGVGQGWTWVADERPNGFKVMYTCFEGRRPDLEAGDGRTALPRHPLRGLHQFPPDPLPAAGGMDRDGEHTGLPVLQQDHHGPEHAVVLDPHERGGARVLEDPLQELLAVPVLVEAHGLEFLEGDEVAEIRVSEHGRA